MHKKSQSLIVWPDSATRSVSRDNARGAQKEPTKAGKKKGGEGEGTRAGAKPQGTRGRRGGKGPSRGKKGPPQARGPGRRQGGGPGGGGEPGRPRRPRQGKATPLAVRVEPPKRRVEASDGRAGEPIGDEGGSQGRVGGDP